MRNEIDNFIAARLEKAGIKPCAKRVKPAGFAARHG